MSFFDSEVVRAELAHIGELQEEVYGNAFKFPSMSMEDKKYHVDLLQQLIEKQKVLYTRLSLSDDPQAQEMKQGIVDSTQMFGLPKNVDMNIVFDNMNQMVDVMKKEFDKSE
jgi:hypothetical protein